jgi:hypothetical protein
MIILPGIFCLQGIAQEDSMAEIKKDKDEKGFIEFIPIHN